MLDVLTVGEAQDDERWAEAWRLVGALWGKSAARAGGRTHLLIGHLLDTAAVAELIWDQYLSLGLKRRWDRVAGGQGRRLFMWICAIHDLGKATPGFQSCDAVEQRRPLDAGLSWRESQFGKKRFRHDRLGAAVLRKILESVWSKKQLDWVWPLVAGHHGAFPSLKTLPFGMQQEQVGIGDRWALAQSVLLESVTASLGFTSLAQVEPAERPSRADQLALAGFVVMADWIASDHTHFKSLDALEDISLERSRDRAAKAWRGLRLRRGWGALPVPDPALDLIRQRFGTPARGCQPMVVQMARDVSAPGLFLVEAPMGEGKTRASFAAAEVVASRFGCDGVLMAMPTQATCTPMYSQMLEWVAGFDPELQDHVQLLHGKRQFNSEWKSIWEQRRDTGDFDEYGAIDEDDCLGYSSERSKAAGPPVWFLGPKRGLLTAFGIATIDQLLFAATRTKHVMLRFAGLAGKVVIIDEVHAADVYMSQFLLECLRLLGQAQVPVILLSATLPPAQRQALCEAYAEGALGQRQTLDLPEKPGYPRVTAVWEQNGQACSRVETAEPWRTDLNVGIEVLEDTELDGAAVANLVEAELREGGTALVVVNSVDRAQQIYARLKSEVDGEVALLLHGRLDDADRAVRTDQCLAQAGPGVSRDPSVKRIIVATQVAEQSFDIDADLLVTDIAPIDLLLQRIGRLHRAVDTPRPGTLSHPKAIITGLRWKPSGPAFQWVSEKIYGRHLLLRSAALIKRALDSQGGSWSVPSQVPELVADGYAESFESPHAWVDAAATAATEWRQSEQRREEDAKAFVLTRESERCNPTLAGLHRFEVGNHLDHANETQVQSLVRDGQMPVEVVLVSLVDGCYFAIEGTRLGPNGEAADETLESLLGGTVRLPLKYSEAAGRELRPLPGWEGNPWLGYASALVLNSDGEAVLRDQRLSYDSEFGLRER